MNSTQKIWFPQMLRAVACLLVCWRHVFEAFWLGPDFIKSLTYNPDFSYLIDNGKKAGFIIASFTWEHYRLSIGTFAVGVFFLISGFVIPFSLKKKSAISFLMARSVRIFPTFIMSIMLGTILLSLYSSHFVFSLPEFFARSLILMRPLTGVSFLDPVAWTLESELLFYIIMAFVFAHLRNIRHLFILSGILTLLSFGFNFAGKIPIIPIFALINQHILNIQFMLLGTLCYKYFIGEINKNNFIIANLVTLAFCLIQLQCSKNINPWSLHITSYGLAYLLFMVCYFRRDQIKFNGTLNFFANISYPLYLVHQLVGYIIMSMLLPYVHNGLFLSSIAFIAVIIIATILHYVIEKPSIKFSKRIL